ncbi:SURF1 family protein [Pseudomonas sp. NPDC078700]|uniref:SURF1 family protein n=1 Tax=Pseudomonas sp. NPDC078700 TaxID=3364424 RepID=UPI0037C9CA51
MSGFRPGVIPSVAVLVLLPVLVSLGFWQLDRAEQKRQMLAAHQLQEIAAPISLDQLEGKTDRAYVRVKLRGSFDNQHSLLLDNRIRDGHAGVEVLQPFYDQISGLWVLLNRGWIPWPDRRTPPTFSTPGSTLQLNASVYVSLGDGLQLQDSGPANAWPTLITKVDAKSLWQQLGRAGLAEELRIEPGLAAFETQWPVVSMSPDKHLGYAVQWFAMALTLVGLFIYLGVHNAREPRNEPKHHHA